MLWGKNAIFLLRADICHFCISDIFQGKHLAISHHEGSLQIYQPHRDWHCAHIDVVSHFILTYRCGCHCGQGRPHQKACWCQYWGMLAVVPERLSPNIDLVISLKPHGGIFSWVPEVSRSGSSTISHLTSGNPRRRLDWNTSGSPLNCSLIWQHQALLLELWLQQCHQLGWVDLSPVGVLMVFSSLLVVGCHWWGSWDNWFISWHSWWNSWDALLISGHSRWSSWDGWLIGWHSWWHAGSCVWLGKLLGLHSDGLCGPLDLCFWNPLVRLCLFQDGMIAEGGERCHSLSQLLDTSCQMAHFTRMCGLALSAQYYRAWA